RMFRTALRRFTRTRRFAIFALCLVFLVSCSSLAASRRRAIYVIGGDDENQVFVADPVVPPDDLHPPAVRDAPVTLDARFRLIPLGKVYPVFPGELHLFRREAVHVNLRQVPVEPQEFGHASFLSWCLVFCV